MGDEQGQGGIAPEIPFVIFLDENHCRNPHLIAAIEAAGIACEKHLDHFPRGTEDIVWLPRVGERRWCLLTADARIRSNFLERESVRQSGVRMFYFSRNNLSGAEMGRAIAKALPEMSALARSQRAPFTASVNKSGLVTLRDTFGHPRPGRLKDDASVERGFNMIPSEVRRVQAAIDNNNRKELEWSLWYARMRQTVPSARPADVKYWSAIERQVEKALEPPKEKVYPVRKKKKENRGLGMGPLPAEVKRE